MNLKIGGDPGSCVAVIVKYNTGYPLHRENRENGKINSLSGKTRGIWKFCQNTGNFVCSSSKFLDSKDAGCCDICRELFKFVEVSFAYEICADFF